MQMVKNKKQLWKRRVKRFKKRLHLWIVPHRNNHYRPHLVRRYGILAVLGVMIGLQFGYNFTQTGSVLGRVTTVTPAALLASTNDARASQSLPALRIDARLSEAAANKARDMLARGYWSHDAPDGTEPWVWLDEAGYSYNRAGENLARSFSSAQATVTAWMDSPSHRDNILNTAYSDVGFAAIDGEMDGKATTIIVAFYGEAASPAQVAGAKVERVTEEAVVDANITPVSRIGIALQSLTPAAAIGLMLLLVAATVAATAHFYRKKLPKHRLESWYKHHGVVKASGLLSVAAFVVLLYGGGQL